MRVLLVLAALALLLAIWLHRAFQEDTTSAARTAIAATSPQNPDDIRLNAWIDDSHIRRKSTITFWIAIQNTTLEPISGVSVLAFRRPNFSLVEEEARKCWAIPARTDATSADAVPVCVAEGSSRLPVKLVAGGVVTVEGHLRAQDEPGQYSIAAVVGWTDAAGVQRRTPISVGPVTVEHEARKTLATITRASQNFLKDLGLPLVFLWLAYWVKQLEEKRQLKNKKDDDDRQEAKKKDDEARQETRKKDDETREANRKKADEENARVRQTWTQMMPKVHENAEKYYMPLMGYALHASKTHAGQRDTGFFYYLRFLARMKEMSDAIGGFYLKTRAGEDMIGALWDAIRIRANDRFTPAVRQALQVAMVSVPTLDVFAALSPASIIAVQDKAFEASSFPVDGILLRLYNLVLTYETNLSYELWYGEPEVFPAAEIEAAMKELEGELAQTGAKYHPLLRSLAQYVAAGKARSVQKNAAKA